LPRVARFAFVGVSYRRLAFRSETRECNGGQKKNEENGRETPGAGRKNRRSDDRRGYRSASGKRARAPGAESNDCRERGGSGDTN
jgi:hypothetical protein